MLNSKRTIVKKIIVTSIFATIVILNLNNNLYFKASSTTASFKTFEIEGLDYIADYYCNDNKNDIEITGDTYLYGNMAMWSSLYTKYVSSSDSKYYFLLVEAKISSNTNSLKGGYYRMVNKQMSIDVKANYNNDSLYLVKYTPETYGSFSVTDTITCSIEFNKNKSFEVSDDGMSGGISLGFNGGISWSQSIYKDNINMIPKSINNNVTLTYNFNNITNKKVNNLSPLRGDSIQRMVFIYELSNYSSNKKNESSLSFEISYQGLIQKVACHISGATGYEILDKSLYIKHKYTSTSILA